MNTPKNKLHVKRNLKKKQELCFQCQIRNHLKKEYFHLCKGSILKMMQEECLHQKKNYSLSQLERDLYHLTPLWCWCTVNISQVQISYIENGKSLPILFIL